MGSTSQVQVRVVQAGDDSFPLQIDNPCLITAIVKHILVIADSDESATFHRDGGCRRSALVERRNAAVDEDEIGRRVLIFKPVPDRAGSPAAEEGSGQPCGPCREEVPSGGRCLHSRTPAIFSRWFRPSGLT